MTQDNN